MSNKITLFVFFNILLLIFNNQKANAQYVTIPDANFVTWLTQFYPQCMNGDQMDTTCSQIVNEDSVDVSNKFISNISGIEYFTNLKYLNCYNNQLSTLPILPNTLLYLDCFHNQINVLPSLPNTLQTIYFSYNQLTSLPSLPNALQFLECNFNLLVSLPAFPDSLQKVYFRNNQITSLPTLPNSLLFLDCEYNQLNSLPALPNTLQALSCNYNLLNNLPVLSNTLQSLGCSNNQLSNLPVLPSTLQSLGCSNNQLSNLPALPSTMHTLVCDNNQLTALPTLPNNIQSLICNNNQLTTIQQVPPQMQNFLISNNSISCLFNLPQVSYGPSANISNNPLTCVPNQTTYSLGLPLCTDNDPINNPNNCPTSIFANCNAHFTLVAETITPHTWNVINQCFGSDSLSADSLSYVWSWGDSLNSTSTGAYPSFTYSSPGNYVICVTITDTTTGCTSSYCDSSTYINKSLSNQIIQVNVVPPNSPLITTNHIIARNEAFRVYPNPANDKLYIECHCGLEPQSQIKIVDVLGNEVNLPYEMKRLSENTFQFSINNLQLSSGVYFIKVGNEVRRFIKE